MFTHKVIGQNRKELRSKVLLYPGEVLEEELEARDIKKSVFAMDLKIYHSHFSNILKGKRDINAAITLTLEKALDIRAEFWVQLQAKYYFKLERQRLQQTKIA